MKYPGVNLRLSAAVIFAIASSTGLAPAFGADAALIAKARSTLYTNRNASITLLEQAVQQHPDEPAYWMEYIHALSVDGLDLFADRASQQAIKMHPDNPELLIARARIQHTGAALETIAALAKLPGQKDQAARLTDMLTCGLSVPESGEWTPETYAILADRLTVIGRPEDAAGWLEQGLAKVAGDAAQPLKARQAILLAAAGKFPEAMKLHTAAGRIQVVMEGSYFGLADVLLDRGKAKLALESFSAEPPADDNTRRLLAIAKSRNNDADGALKLLAGKEMQDQLLRCRVLLTANRNDDAKALGASIVEPLRVYQGSYFGPSIGVVFNGPESVAADCLFAVRWLNSEFPDQKKAIAFDLGTGEEKRNPQPSGWSPAEPVSVTIPRLEAAVRSSVAQEREAARRSLITAYIDADRYGDAMALLAQTPVRAYRDVIHQDWSTWSLLRRRAEAEAASEKDFAMLASIRATISACRDECFQSNGQDRTRGLPDERQVKAMIAVGSPVLADVLTQLGPNTISGQDRRPWVSVVEALGSVEDAPVLIATLGNVTRPEKHPSPRQDDNDQLTAAAIERCLQKLTSAEPDGINRATAWTLWWAENHAAVVKP